MKKEVICTLNFILFISYKYFFYFKYKISIYLNFLLSHAELLERIVAAPV
jgi:hypothetical protein